MNRFRIVDVEPNSTALNRLQHQKNFSAAGYSVKKDFQNWHFFSAVGDNGNKYLLL